METILGIDLPTWWFLVLGAVLSGYAILDGFDLGAGASHLFFNKEESRRIALNAIGPVWDGNEVWLVIAGGVMFAGFPVLYASALSGMYVLFILLFVGIIWRAVAIEFRSKEKMLWWRQMWDVTYTFSSITIALVLGLILGNVIFGLEINKEGDYLGSTTSLFNPYAIITAVTTLSLFMMHGAVFLAMKTEGRLYTKLTIMIRRFTYFFVISFTALSFASLIYVPVITNRLKGNPVLFLFPIITVMSIFYITNFIRKRKYRLAFLSSSITIASMFCLVAISIYPNLLFSTITQENNITIYNAASSTATLKTLLLIACIGTPLVITYTVFVFYTFRGKVKIDETSY
jgi:cytochrome bd ubiquinol oxidase subunit II